MKTHSAHDSIGRPLRAPGLRWLLGSTALIAGLVAYCELCSLVYGEPGVGARTSWVWAVQASVGWILVGAALGAFGERLAASACAQRHGRVVLIACVLTAAAFSVGCEGLLTWLMDDAPLTGARDSVAALIYARAPVSVLASTLLAVAWIAQRTTSQDQAAAPVNPDASETDAVETVSGYGAADVLDVMTGTGRATIRIADVESFRADRNYITVAHVSGRRYLLRQTMTTLARSLDPARFERVHRSTIVNREMVTEIRRGGVLVLRSGDTVQVSRARRKRRGSAPEPF
jgi:two-component system, LytTR family, response regulator